MSKMSKEQLIERLMGTFLDELSEHVDAINGALLTLEKIERNSEEQKEIMRTLFRAVHSLKGASRAVAQPSIENLCHHLENLLEEIQTGDRDTTPTIIELLFETVKTFETAGSRLRKKQELNESDIQQLLDRLLLIGNPPAKEIETHVSAIAPVSCLKAEAAKEVLEPRIEQRNEVQCNKRNTNGDNAQTTVNSNSSHNGSNGTSDLGNEGHEYQSMRVSTEKLDKLLKLSGELLSTYQKSQVWEQSMEAIADSLRVAFSKSQAVEKSLPQSLPAAEENTRSMRDLVKEVDRFRARLKMELRAVSETARLVDEEIRGLRMRPFSDACLGLQLAVRELAQSTGKPVDIDIVGGTVEIDSAVLEGLKNPLLHILRNAVEHGIEATSTRLEAGKPEVATIRLSASLAGSNVQIQIEDDGRGIDEEGVRNKTKSLGLPEPKTPKEVSATIFSAGFSTSRSLNAVSGRGVGLDVVANQVSALQGSVSVDYQANQGTCFTLTVPLTLSKIRALLVEAGEQTYAIPCGTIRRLVRLRYSQLICVTGCPMISFENHLIPVAQLTDALGFANGMPKSDQLMPAVIVEQGGKLGAFTVDKLVAEQETVVTNLGNRLSHLRFVSGATLLASGDIALILNTAELLNRKAETTKYAHSTDANLDGSAKKNRLLIVDDSPTTRILEASILEASGFDVITAADGSEALEQLMGGGADLVVSDVEMPTMDGLMLTKMIRASENFKHMPVVLVTGLAKESDRQNGLNAGANAYLVKSEFDQTELLETIERLIEESNP